MPEIKHNFTKGKMNKDLDERLVPNGEYRDAMNIQVSTSEGSHVGTVQNILGNQKVDCQHHLPTTAHCIGSISDEKNDSLYWFVHGNESYGNATTIKNALTAAFDAGGEIRYTWRDFILKHDTKVDCIDFIFVDVYKTSMLAIALKSTEFILYNISNIKIGDKVNWIDVNTGMYLPNNSAKIIEIQPTSGTEGKIILSKSILSPSNGYLDITSNRVLNFEENRLITGINIIDDMLFWTDNYSEPKKINIPRSIEGTYSSGASHTQLINHDQGIDLTNGIYILEEHITVIKKSPPNPLSLELFSERTDDLGKIYTGVMHATQPFVVVGVPSSPPPPLLPGEHAPNFINNLSSFNFGQNYAYSYDWHQAEIDKIYELRIETDINGNSGFSLDWKIGDTLLFKAFGGSSYTDPPSLPLRDYAIKGNIIDHPWVNNFNDANNELLENGDFIIPIPFNQSNNVLPKNWKFSNPGGTIYYPINSEITLNYPANSGWHKIIYDNVGVIYQPGNAIPTDPFGEYQVTVNISNYISGKLRCYFIANDGRYWYSNFINNPGPNTFTFQLLDSNSTTPASPSGGWHNYYDDFVIQVDDASGFKGSIDNISIKDLNAADAKVAIKITAINSSELLSVPDGQYELKYVVDKEEKEEKLFEFKFPRFAYRYKYKDGEYSAMSTFSDVAFLPGSFSYHPKRGYNLGMTNRLNKVIIKNFMSAVPQDVISIDILYKEEGKTSIYVVDTIKPKDDVSSGSNAWYSGKYTIESEVVKNVLPSNQILRPWDNVPRKALAQDITGNRIVYGNYIQNYDLKSSTTDKDYYAAFNINLISAETENVVKSIKSLREYQLGVLFIDEYGRETPILTNPKGTFKLNKSEADKKNQISVSFDNEKFPIVDKNNQKINIEHFKFFIKEVSNEYYNLAMDRFWVDKDNQAWISFPSSDRNKIDIDSFLILKKGVGNNRVVTDPARYKVIAIENEAPEFIKVKKVLLEEQVHINATNNLFGTTTDDAPLWGRDSFKMNYAPFMDGSGGDLSLIDDGILYVEFCNLDGACSDRYRINEIAHNYKDETGVALALADAKYSIKLDSDLGEDVNIITDDPTGVSPSKITDTTTVNIYKYTPENTEEFEGRFFVKLYKDDVFVSNINNSNTINLLYRVVLAKKLFYMDSVTTINGKSKHHVLHNSALTGQSEGGYSEFSRYQVDEFGDLLSPGNNNAQTGFGFFTTFFRNYPIEQNTITISNAASSSSLEDLSPYAFGDFAITPSIYKPDWWSEFAHCTSSGVSSGGPGIWNNSFGWSNLWNGIFPPHGHTYILYGSTKEADKDSIGDAVWFIDRGKFEGKRDGWEDLDWNNINSSSGINKGLDTTPDNDGAGQINIGFGGIYHDDFVEWDGSNPIIKDFFAIGKEGQSFGGAGENPNYTNLGQFVNLLTPGSKFRFREDPNGYIYTVQNNVDNQRLLRYGDQKPWYDAGTSKQIYQVNQLSPNFTKNWILRIKNEDGDSQVKWNPVDGMLPIQNGHNLTATTISSGCYNAVSHDFSVIVTSMEIIDNFSGKLVSLHKGLMLTDYVSSSSTVSLSFNPAHQPPYTTANVGIDYQPLIIKQVERNTPTSGEHTIHFCGYSSLLYNNHIIHSSSPDVSTSLTFRQPTMNGYSQNSVNRINANDSYYSTSNPGVLAIGYYLEFVEPVDIGGEGLPDNPAVWETEPKESTELDIYYEASGLIPLEFNHKTANIGIPINSIVTHLGSSFIPLNTKVILVNGLNKTITLDTNIIVGNQGVNIGDMFKITKPDGSIIIVEVTDWVQPVSGVFTNTFEIYNKFYSNKTTHQLSWHNCYSFGNGVESNRIRDSFNLPYILNGVKASTTLENEYQEEHRKYGLIYSGLYNSVSGVNNLNQFIQAEKITKDINPTYGSIQKLHARDSDLVTLCEDKVLRILANKDAIYEADGNPNLTATERVLGQTMPFVGEFGISKNPESFASEAYRSYFTDKQRGAVMRLSKDGLTPISMHGMKDWFRDNLKLSNKLIGSYDDRNDEYNITLDGTTDEPVTVSFKEDVRGWVSFKSFVPENAISCANDYFTILDGKLYKHYNESVGRNTFYGTPVDSSVNVILNDSPGSVKSFHTLDYEGSQSKIEAFTFDSSTGISDVQPYNLKGKSGWYVSSFVTDLEEGSLNEFIEKEGKWFNYLRGKSVTTSPTKFVDSNYDTDSFAIQGIGHPYSTTQSTPGCMSTSATNYQPLATADDGSCIHACNANLESIVSINNVTITDATSVFVDNGAANIAFTIPADPVWGIGMKLANTNTGSLYPISSLIDFVPLAGSPNTYSYLDNDITLTCARNTNNCWDCNLIALTLSAAEYDFVLEASTSTATCNVDEHFIVDAPPPCVQIPNCVPCGFILSKVTNTTPNLLKVLVDPTSGPQCNNYYLNGPATCAGTNLRISFKYNVASSSFPSWHNIQTIFVNAGQHSQMSAVIGVTSPYNNPGTEVMATVKVTPPLGLDSPCVPSSSVAGSTVNWPYWTVPSTGGMSAGTFYNSHTNIITW